MYYVRGKTAGLTDGYTCGARSHTDGGFCMQVRPSWVLTKICRYLIAAPKYWRPESLTSQREITKDCSSNRAYKDTSLLSHGLVCWSIWMNVSTSSEKYQMKSIRAFWETSNKRSLPSTKIRGFSDVVVEERRSWMLLTSHMYEFEIDFVL